MQTKFKTLAITLANGKAINAALAEINGRSQCHTFNSWTQFLDIRDAAEAKMHGLGLSAKKHRIGAKVIAISGGIVPNCYKSNYRNATRVVLMLKSNGWCITEMTRTEIDRRGGSETLMLTAAQAAQAHKFTAAKFGILPA